jgi:hypothetical protein
LSLNKIFERLAGNLTLKGAILPAMLEALMNAIDTDEIVAKIKECQILTDKVAMWQTLKEMAFGKIICG